MFSDSGSRTSGCGSEAVKSGVFLDFSFLYFSVTQLQFEFALKGQGVMKRDLTEQFRGQKLLKNKTKLDE